MPKAIVLKHLAKEFNMDDYPLRQILRQEFGKPKSGRWSWDDKTNKEYKAIHQFLTERQTNKDKPKTKQPKATPKPAKKKATLKQIVKKMPKVVLKVSENEVL